MKPKIKILLLLLVLNAIYCGVWPIKYRQGSKTNKYNCRF
jgi:hypothetical protein